jgi:hypothetical protein
MSRKGLEHTKFREGHMNWNVILFAASMFSITKT